MIEETKRSIKNMHKEKELVLTFILNQSFQGWLNDKVNVLALKTNLYSEHELINYTHQTIEQKWIELMRKSFEDSTVNRIEKPKTGTIGWYYKQLQEILLNVCCQMDVKFSDNVLRTKIKIRIINAISSLIYTVLLYPPNNLIKLLEKTYLKVNQNVQQYYNRSFTRYRELLIGKSQLNR